VDDRGSFELLRDAAQLAGIESSIVLPEDRYVRLGGLRFHYLNWPGADAPVIVFLHGGALSAHTWDLVCLALRNEYRCIALDQRGHGDSDWSEDLAYSRSDHSRDLHAFADALWLGNLVLVGQSMGAINAMTFAARHPSYVAALVIVDAGPEVEMDGTQRIADFVRGPSELPSVDDFVERAARFNPRRDRTLLRRSLLHNLRRLESGSWTWKYDTRRFASSDPVERIRSELDGLWDDVASITCPTLVVRGAESDVFTDAQAERLAQRLRSGRRTTIAGAGHTVQGDAPLRLSQALRMFLHESDIEPKPGAGPWQAA
jgi:esterase